MNTLDMIELPPLPKGDIAADTCPVMWVHSNEQLQAYAREAIEADRQRRRVPVKHKRRYAQGTALSEFGVIPMCDQVESKL